MPSQTHPRPSPFLVAVSLSAALVGGIIGFTASAAIVDSMALASVVALVVAAGVGRWLTRSSRLHDAAAQAPPAFRRLFMVGALLLCAQLGALTVFIINPYVASWNPHVWAPMQSRHSCMSSYWVACRAIEDGRDVFDETLYSRPQADPRTPRTARTLGPFAIDVYEYPPTFLTLPWAMRLVSPDFYAFRRLWFALTLAVVAVGIVAVAWRLDRTLGTNSVWLTPLVLAAPPMIATMHMGNVQLAVIAAAMAAMLLFERRWYVSGGLLLAYVTAGKLFPGLLVLYLLLRRDWRAVGATAAWGVALAIASVALFGIAPWHDFLDHFPKLLSGEAFPAFRRPDAIGVNQSVPGIVFKLKLFNVPHMDFAAMRIVGWIYTLVAVAGTVWLALRAAPRGREPLVWLIILILATLRSPFLPTYAGFPTFWLVTLVAALCAGRPAIIRFAALVWVMHAVLFGLGTIDPRINAVWTTLQTGATFALVAVAWRLLRQPVAAEQPAVLPAAAPA